MADFNPENFDLEPQKVQTQPKSPWRNFVDGLFNRDWGNTNDVLASAAQRGFTDALDAIETLSNVPGLSPLAGPGSLKRLDQGLQGKNPVSSAVRRRLQTPENQDVGDKYAGAAMEGAVSSLPMAEGGSAKALQSVLTGGAGSGIGGQAAEDLFPNSPLAQMAGSIVGGIAGGIAPNIRGIKTGLRIRDGMSNPDFQKALEITAGSESDFNPNAVSPKGARGILQVMPDTARDPGHGIRPSNGSQADDARVGTQLFATLLSKYGHDYEKTWAAYNWGEGRVDAAVKKYGDYWYDHAPEETQNYVAKNMTELYGGPQVGEHGAVGGPVAPMEPANIANAMQDQEMLTALNQPKDNVVQFPDLNAPLSERFPDLSNASEHLTPAERQEMDASVPTVPVDNTGYEKFTPNSEPPPAANDALAALPEDATLADRMRARGPFKTRADFEAAMKEELGNTGGTRKEKPDFNPPVKMSNSGQGEQTENTGGTSGKEPPPPPPPSGGGEEPPEPPKESPVDKLNRMLEKAANIRGKNDLAVKRERAKRFAEAQKTSQFAKGEAGYYAQLAKMKGKMPSPDFSEINEKFTQEDVDQLYQMIQDHPRMNYGEKLKAQGGLGKLLGLHQNGDLPTSEEISLLNQVFPESMIDGLKKADKTGMTLGEHVASGLTLPRAVMASFDISAPGRQGAFLIGRKAWWTSWDDMLKSMTSEKAFNELLDQIRSDPDYKYMKKGGLALTGVGHDLSKREEAFTSVYADKIPGVKASERAYVAFLNKVRADTFKEFLDKGRKLGIDFDNDPKYVEAIGRYINAATGRGDLGKFSQAAEFMSRIFFAPRLIASRLQLLNPMFYARLPGYVRVEALKDLFAFAGVAIGSLSLAAAAGASVEWDPRSADFGKIRIGDTRLDMLGGFGQYIRPFFQIITSQTKNTDTGKVTNLVGGVGLHVSKGNDQAPGMIATGKATTAEDIAKRFVENKFAPITGLMTDMLRGSNAVGQKNDFKTLNPSQNALMSRLTPLVIQDVIDAMQEYGIKGAAVAPPALVGIGVQTYQQKHNKKSKGTSEFSAKDFGAGATFKAKDFQ